MQSVPVELHKERANPCSLLCRLQFDYAHGKHVLAPRPLIRVQDGLSTLNGVEIDFSPEQKLGKRHEDVSMGKDRFTLKSMRFNIPAKYTFRDAFQVRTHALEFQMTHDHVNQGARTQLVVTIPLLPTETFSVSQDFFSEFVPLLPSNMIDDVIKDAPRIVVSGKWSPSAVLPAKAAFYTYTQTDKSVTTIHVIFRDRVRIHVDEFTRLQEILGESDLDRESSSSDTSVPLNAQLFYNDGVNAPGIPGTGYTDAELRVAVDAANIAINDQRRNKRKTHTPKKVHDSPKNSSIPRNLFVALTAFFFVCTLSFVFGMTDTIPRLITQAVLYMIILFYMFCGFQLTLILGCFIMLAAVVVTLIHYGSFRTLLRPPGAFVSSSVGLLKKNLLSLLSTQGGLFKNVTLVYTVSLLFLIQMNMIHVQNVRASTKNALCTNLVRFSGDGIQLDMCENKTPLRDFIPNPTCRKFIKQKYDTERKKGRNPAKALDAAFDAGLTTRDVYNDGFICGEDPTTDPQSNFTDDDYVYKFCDLKASLLNNPKLSRACHAEK